MGIGNRMKIYYENVTRYKLYRRTPAIIRLDGKAFHSLTRKCKKPFDQFFQSAMQVTAVRLCEQIQNVRLAYLQSDEISLLLNDYENLDTDQWFDGNIQKMVSVSASIASVYFSQIFGKIGLFDSRVFNLPKEEVNNYFLWRQQDATRNSIQGVAQSQFSHKELMGLNGNQLQEKLWKDKQINWNDTPTHFKRCYCIVKGKDTKKGEELQ